MNILSDKTNFIFAAGENMCKRLLTRRKACIVGKSEQKCHCNSIYTNYNYEPFDHIKDIMYFPYLNI